MDIVSREVRSKIMGRIRGKDTRPEMLVRSAAHRLGLRFRLHDRRLPGSPDLVFRKHRTVIFVHGCFWHRHGCKLAATPKTRPEFWATKFEANTNRDRRNRAMLEEQGWRVLEVWECETGDRDKIRRQLARWFCIDLRRVEPPLPRQPSAG